MAGDQENNTSSCLNNIADADYCGWIPCVSGHLDFRHMVIGLAGNFLAHGKSDEGFIEGTENGNYIARIPSQAPEVDGVTYISGSPKTLPPDSYPRSQRNKRLKVSDLVKISITDADIYDLFGEIVSTD